VGNVFRAEALFVTAIHPLRRGNEADPANKSMEPVMNFKPFRDFFASWMPPGISDKEYVIAQYDGAVAVALGKERVGDEAQRPGEAEGKPIREGFWRTPGRQIGGRCRHESHLDA
jgi:hypothetical protein